MAKYALCPFFEYEKDDILHCEHGNIEFPGKNDRNMWLGMHCNSWDHKMCKFYTILMKKYDKDN